MDIEYKKYEPGKGLEDLQAALYSKLSGNNVTADQIRGRYENEKIDPETVRYAFSGDKMIAYVQARDYPDPTNETHIGYPWATEECPAEVKDKLFDDLLAYMKQRKGMKTLALRANVPADNEDTINFFKKRGFVEKSSNHRYEVNLDEVSKSDYSGDFTTKIATNDDLNLLVDLLKADGRFSTQFGTDEAIAEYFTGRVLKDGHAVMVYDKDEVVMASAPLVFKLPRAEDESLILRFHSFKKGHEKAYKPLIAGIAKECVSTGYGKDKPLTVFIGRDDGHFAEVLDEYKPNKIVTGYSMGLEE